MENNYYLLKLKRDDNNYTINNNTTHNYISKSLLKTLDDSDIIIKNGNFPLSKIVKNINKYTQAYLLKAFKININDSYSILSKDTSSNFFIIKNIDYGQSTKFINHINEVTVKYKNIFYNMVSSDLYNHIKKLSYCKREEYLYENKIATILHLYDYLEKDGNFFLSFHSFCNIENIINIYYVLCYMFDYCVIYEDIIICKKFNPILDKNNLLLMKNMEISVDKNINLLVKYIQSYIEYKINLNKLIINKNDNDFFTFYIHKTLLHLNSYKPTINKSINYFSFIIKNLNNNNEVKTFIVNLLNTNNIHNCLQLGLDYGIYAYYILNGTKCKLLSIDPYQITKWNSKGIELLQLFKLNNRHVQSLTYLNKMLKYSFILLDCNKDLIYLINDFMQIHSLLNIGGYLVIHNVFSEDSLYFIDFIEKNYIYYEKINSPLSLYVFKKNSNGTEIYYYDEYNSKLLKETVEIIKRYKLNEDSIHLTKQYDWILKKRDVYLEKFETKSWKRTAFQILVEPNYKPNIQILNKYIKYQGDNGQINTLDSEFPEQILCDKYILPDDCVLEIGARYGTVSNVINYKLRNKTDQVSIDADLSIKKYHNHNKKQYINEFIEHRKKSNTYHSFFGMLDNSDKQYFLQKIKNTYGNIVKSFNEFKDDEIVTSIKKDKRFGDIKNSKSKIKKYSLNKIRYEDIQKTFNLSKPINVLVLDCEGCSNNVINQINSVKMLPDIEIILLEMDHANLCNYQTLDTILTNNDFILHVGIWYNAIYVKKERLKKYKDDYFKDEWWDKMMEINENIQISSKYNKK